MELQNLNVHELIEVYSESVKELKKRGILRTKNVAGEIGEFFVIEKYNSTKGLPTLTALPTGTMNINAIDQNGERYSIKTTSGSTTGVFYGLEPKGSKIADERIFEYVIICKLDDNYALEGIYQLDWNGFQKHKKWHSRMNAWNLTLSESLKKDSLIVFDVAHTEKNEKPDSSIHKEVPSMKRSESAQVDIDKPDPVMFREVHSRIQTESPLDEKVWTMTVTGKNLPSVECEETAISSTTSDESGDIDKTRSTSGKSKVKAVSWGKTPAINHEMIRNKTAERIATVLGEKFLKQSQSRYISIDRKKALFIMSSKYSEKNGEYWYSINDENFPWMELFNECYIAFAMGSEKHVLVFPYRKLKEMMKGCLKTKRDEAKGKVPHYHFSFAVEGRKHIYFKKKVPEHDFIDVTDALLENWK